MIRNQDACYFLTFQIVGWMDLFTRRVYRDIVVDSLQYCQENKGLLIYGWVIMSNHVHCIFSSSTGNLSGTIRDFKRHTSKEFFHCMDEVGESRRQWLSHQFKYWAGRQKRNENYQIWTHDNHPVELQGEWFEQRLEYIHNNPVVAGIVGQPEDYLYSSAIDYAGGKGLLELVYF
jgi:REP element-mobilizing transposase RayT